MRAVGSARLADHGPVATLARPVPQPCSPVIQRAPAASPAPNPLAPTLELPPLARFSPGETAVLPLARQAVEPSPPPTGAAPGTGLPGPLAQVPGAGSASPGLQRQAATAGAQLPLVPPPVIEVPVAKGEAASGPGRLPVTPAHNLPLKPSVVQRVVEPEAIPGPTEPAPTQLVGAQPAEPVQPAAAPEPPDPAELARQVLPYIKRMLAVERERRTRPY
jgi:hypothetical protein